MGYQETFLDGLHASSPGMLNSRDFSVTGNFPVQASTGKLVTESGDGDQLMLSENGSYPKQFGETIDWNCNVLPEVYLENCRVKKSQVSAER